MQDVVIGMLFKDGKLLVGQRLTKPFIGCFECPGGKVEVNESLFDALKREFIEEGACLIQSAKMVFDYPVEYLNLHMYWFVVETDQEFKPIIYKQLHYIQVDQVDDLAWINHNLPYRQAIKACFKK